MSRLTCHGPWFSVASPLKRVLNVTIMAAKKSRNTQSSAVDFEASLARLEQLVEKMESGELGLEESLKAFEEGVRLTRLCQETLNNAQQKVQTLMEKDGALSLEDVTGADEDDD